jgi:hypothetical protein
VRSWILDAKNLTECGSGELEPAEEEPTSRGLEQDPPGRLSRGFSKYKQEKIVTAGQGKKKYTARQCRVCAKKMKQHETRYICKWCVVPLHRGSCFERFHSIKHYWTHGKQFLQHSVKEWHQELQKVSKNVF